jgi:hypothetical protein
MTAASDAAGGEARAGGLPEIIHLPDQSQPPPEKKRGRHFGAHRVRDPRSARIHLRVTPAQHAAMETAANDAGLSVSALICRQTLGSAGPRARHRPAPDMATLAQLLAQLGKLGGNLNQIAHRMNEYDFGGERELMEMRAEHRAILAQHRALYDALLVVLGV